MSPKRPSLRQLEYFSELAQTLNFRKAADRLNVSQPTLTAQITTLEEVLGVTLFERSRSGTLLSVQGRTLLPSAKQVLASTRNFEEQAHELACGPATTFRLGVPPTLGPYLLPNVLPELHKTYDRLQLYVREASPRQLEQQLLSGEYDLILAPLSIHSDELAQIPLFIEPLKLVLPSDHPLAGTSEILPEKLKGESVLTLEEHHHFHLQVGEICSKLGARLLRDFEGTSLDTLRQMVVMGIGITFLPGLYIHSELHRPEAVQVCELKDMPIVRQHTLAWRNTSPSRVFFRQLAQRIKDIVKQRLATVVTVME